MSEWPSEISVLLLTLGLGPLAFVIWKSFLSKSPEGLSLRFWGTVLPWTAYQASPFGAYFFGILWRGSDCPIAYEHVNSALLFSTLAMYGMLAGYRGPQRANRRAHEAILRLSVSPLWLFAMASLFSIAFVVSINGIAEIWISSEPRGAFQWMEVDLWWQVRRIANIICIIGSPVIAVLATLTALKARGSYKLFAGIIVALLLIVLMAPGAHNFSRITGLPLIVSGAVILNQRRRYAAQLGLFAVGSGAMICLIALSQRPAYEPGLANFLTALGDGVNFSGRAGDGVADLGVINPVRSTERFTITAEVREQVGERNLSDCLTFFANVQPLPSFVVGVRPIVQPLAEYLGYSDNTCLPIPFYAELYYVFGYMGALLMAPIGWVYAWFDRRRQSRPGVASSIAHFLCLASIGVGTHDTARPLTRFLLYGAAVIVADGLIRAQMSRSFASPTNPRRYRLQNNRRAALARAGVTPMIQPARKHNRQPIG